MQHKNERNLLGGYDMWAAVMPGMNFIAYILGLFTISVEVFLRRDFGERYVTRMNAFAGLIVLVFWKMGQAVFDLYKSRTDAFNQNFSSGEPVAPTVTHSGLGWIIILYILLCTYHFLRIWWRNSTGKPLYSFDSGKSWLEPLGALGMGIANKIGGVIAQIYVATLPANEQTKLPRALPMLKDVRDFTERIVEPMFILVLGIVLLLLHWVGIGAWLIGSAVALMLYTPFRLDAERYKFLDMQDKMIETAGLKNFLLGNHTTDDTVRMSYSTKAALQDVKQKVEKNPELQKDVKTFSPSLADAMAALNPKLKAMMPKEEEVLEAA